MSQHLKTLSLHDIKLVLNSFALDFPKSLANIRKHLTVCSDSLPFVDDQFFLDFMESNCLLENKATLYIGGHLHQWKNLRSADN